jgi:hypothetical protein
MIIDTCVRCRRERRRVLQGEYIAVEKLEGEYKKCSYVNQVWVYGARPRTPLASPRAARSCMSHRHCVCTSEW